jgi:excisionase family DNA binding protein
MSDEPPKAPEPRELRPLLITVKQACELLQVSHVTVYALWHAGKLRSMKIGARRLFTYESAERLVAAGQDVDVD